MKARDLAKRTGLTPPRVRRALAELVASGYIATTFVHAGGVEDYERVHAAAAADLAARRFCLAAEGGGVCHLDAGHKPPHRARVGERIDTPRGPKRQIIEWGAK